MARIQCQNYTSNEELSTLRLKWFFFDQMKSQVAAIKKVYEEIQIQLIMECVFDVD